MKFLAKILLLPLALMAQIAFANAESAARTIGGVSLNLPAPSGFCIADERNPVDARFVGVVSNFLSGAQNRLVMTSVECGTLAKFRAHAVNRISDYALYYVPFMAENEIFPGDQVSLRKGLCTEMRGTAAITAENINDVVAQKAREMGQNIGVNSTSDLGVIDEDAHGCYAGLLLGLRDDKGNNVIMSAIITTTVLRNKPVFFAYYAEFKGPETTAAGVKAAKATAAELDAANP